jgi:hypothetical protein
VSVLRRAGLPPQGNELEFLKAVLRRAEERGQRVDGRILRIEPMRHEAREGIALTPQELAELASRFPEDTKRLVLLAGTVGARQNGGSPSTSASSSSTATSRSCASRAR